MVGYNTLQPLPALCCSWLLRASVLHRLQSSCCANCWSTSSTDSCGWQNSNSILGSLWACYGLLSPILHFVYPQIVVSPWPAKILALVECRMNVFWGSRENHPGVSKGVGNPLYWNCDCCDGFGDTHDPMHVYKYDIYMSIVIHSVFIFLELPPGFDKKQWPRSAEAVLIVVFGPCLVAGFKVFLGLWT